MASLLISGCLGKSSEAKYAKDLKSTDPEVRINAANKLAEVATAEAQRLLILHREDPDYRVKEAVKKALQQIDKRTFLN
jgi:HEAT repeat protein